MRCSICTHPAIGIANLTGRLGKSCEGSSGCYPLCKWHLEEIQEDRWKTVELDGWEPLMLGPELETAK